MYFLNHYSLLNAMNLIVHILIVARHSIRLGHQPGAVITKDDVLCTSLKLSK